MNDPYLKFNRSLEIETRFEEKMNLNFLRRIIQNLMKNVCYWNFQLLRVNLLFFHFLQQNTCNDTSKKTPH